MRLFIVFLLIFLCGCSRAELRQAFFGMGIADLEKAEKKYTKVIDAEPSYCFAKTVEIIKGMNVEIIRKNIKSGFLVANRFDRTYKLVIDTTSVGILMKPSGLEKTEVCVYSGNYELARDVSSRLFKELETPTKKPEK